MHELSIASNIVEIASRFALENGAERVIAVRVRIGVLAAVAPAALAFCYEVAVRDTPLEGSRLMVELVPAVVHCPACNRDTELPEVSQMACAACGVPTGDVLSGRELEVEAIEVV